MVGSGVAMPENVISIANNPAAALKTAGKFDAGLAVFSPKRHYESPDSLANGQGSAFTIGPNDIDSSNNYFYIPDVAGSWKINDESAFAFAPFTNTFAESGGTVFPQNLSNNGHDTSFGAGFGWDNMTVYKIGGQWEASDDWTNGKSNSATVGGSDRSF